MNNPCGMVNDLPTSKRVVPNVTGYPGKIGHVIGEKICVLYINSWIDRFPKAPVVAN